MKSEDNEVKMIFNHLKQYSQKFPESIIKFEVNFDDFIQFEKNNGKDALHEAILDYTSIALTKEILQEYIKYKNIK